MAGTDMIIRTPDWEYCKRDSQWFGRPLGATAWACVEAESEGALKGVYLPKVLDFLQLFFAAADLEPGGDPLDPLADALDTLTEVGVEAHYGRLD